MVIPGRTGISHPPRDIAALAAAVREVLDDPAAAQRRAVARQRLTADPDWHTVAHNTAQVYLAAKRRERGTAAPAGPSWEWRCPPVRLTGTSRPSAFRPRTANAPAATNSTRR